MNTPASVILLVHTNDFVLLHITPGASASPMQQCLRWNPSRSLEKVMKTRRVFVKLVRSLRHTKWTMADGEKRTW